MNARPVACPSLIGRDRELALLNDARRALAQSRAAFVLIAGEPGIGKSRLLAQFVRTAAEGRARTIVSVECLEHAPRAFGPVREALAALSKSTGEPLPPELAHVAAPDASPEAERTIDKVEFFSAVVAFVRERARDRATILTFEDLHWSDATTLEFLGYLASRIAGTRLLVVVTYRTGEAQTNDALRMAIARAAREATTFQLDLRELKLAEIRALLHGAAAGHVPLEAAALDEIASRADGNPFFGEELLKNALEAPDVARRSDLPVSIRASIVERLRTFTPDERRTIDRAAVLGLRFDPIVLARTMQTSVEAILPALRRARDANIVVEEDAERVRFRFRHALTRQAVYDELLLFDARRTHRAILETLESFDAESDYIEELAYHAWESRDAPKTLRYNERAGERAFALFALPEARVCFARALEVASDRGDSARILERLGRVTSMLGDLSGAIELYESARGAYVELEQFDRAAGVVTWSAADRNNSGDAGSVAYGTAFLDRFGARVGTTAHDTLVAMLARLATISYDVDTSSALLARLRAPDDLPGPAYQNALFARSDIAWIRGDIRGWAESAERLIEILPSLSPFLTMSAGYTLAQGASYGARDDLVTRIFSHIDRIEARTDVRGLRTYAIAIRTLDHFARGRLERARDTIRSLADLPDVHVSKAALAIVAPHVANALDDDSLVPSDLDAEFASVRRNARHADDAIILASSAVCLLRAGRRRDALDDLRRALGSLARGTPSSDAVLSLCAEHLDRSELPMLDRFLDLDTYAVEDVVSRANALVATAIIARRRGEDSRAIELALAAADAFRAMGRPLREGHALEIAGRIDDARTIYARCGAIGYLKRLEPPAGETTREPGRDPLSEREREVATYVAAGLGNAAIAERLAITKKTVEKHVASIYDKLGVRSRAQLAGLLARAVP